MRLLQIPNTELKVSALCLGTAQLGLDMEDTVDALFNAFRDAGGNFLDTAHCYRFWADASGSSERAIAGYFRRNGGRDEMIVATKGGHTDAPGYRKVDGYMSPRRLAGDIDDSLGRLECDCIDLYWLHRDDVRVPVAEVIEYLNQEVRLGRIRWFGGSNWTVARLAEANAYAADHGLRGFVASQPEWSLGHCDRPVNVLQPVFDEASRAWHARTGMPVMAYTPTARGYFATGGASGADYDNAISRGRLKRAQNLARRIGRTPNQVALAYLMNHPFPIIPILGTSSVDHLKDALGAADTELSADQVRWLRDGD